MLRSEYRTRLDMHSLGLTALQVLVETMPPDITLPAAHSAGEVISEIHKLRSAWVAIGRFLHGPDSRPCTNFKV
ncbi:hypothetical protein AK812_SmicGene45588 [Symbiodinium microadriaticum]|uniref:Uncharacterized protein n=1 Tax=Symbiodinium microadriaticum TaxID=2951 RepID=A0A1Q9BVQ1_SYMMI|nr:hypothetical protein AK812_SmicGene45588 [Symbiodinium microadriaticum]